MAKQMIEPYVSDKQCTTCKQCKPIGEFGRSSRWPDGYRRQCLECSRACCRASTAKRRAMGPRKVAQSATAWLMPADTRPDSDKALDYVLRSFRLCEPAANLVAVIGRAA